MTAALVIFALTYLVVAGARLPRLVGAIDRPAAAMCGAVAMVAFGVLTLDEAYAAVSLNTITLLLGMMVIAAYLMEARFFRTTAWWVVTRTRSARSLLWALVFTAGGLSAVLVNDTVCLMFTPLVLAVITEAELPPMPYLFALASATNVGGMVTYTGNPQNMIIGMTPGAPSYLDYTLHVLPAGVLCLAADAALLTWMFRKELPRGRLIDRSPPRPYFDKPLAGKGVAVLLLFITLAMSGHSLAGAAMTAAALLILIARVPARPALARVDWLLLLLFSGLFVVVRGLETSGALAHVLAPLEPVLARGDAVGTAAFAGFAVLGSNVVSNVPFVLIAVRTVEAMPDPAWGFTVLAVSSTLAGNLTLFGSMANLIVFESAGPRGEIGFGRFLRTGFMLTSVTLVLALGLLWAQRSLGF